MDDHTAGGRVQLLCHCVYSEHSSKEACRQRSRSIADQILTMRAAAGSVCRSRMGPPLPRKTSGESRVALGMVSGTYSPE